MRLNVDDPPQGRPVRWYFTPPGAKVFTGVNAFTSLNYIDKAHRPVGGPGEVAAAPRPWANGHMPGPFTGQAVCGTPSWFATGSPAGTPDQSVMTCCGGGGGTHLVSCCPNPFPTDLFIRFTNLSGCACLDGVILHLVFFGFQTWQGTAPVNCGAPLTLTATFECSSGGLNCMAHVLRLTCDGSNFEGRSPTVCTCSPLRVEFHFSLLFGCCGPGQDLMAVVSP
jgi:hypothetical protein